MNVAFGLSFVSLEPGPVVAAASPPSLSLDAPEAGWIRWRIGSDDAATTIRMSYVYPPLVSLWAWASAIAHRLLPVSLRIDEEGIYTDLCAEWAGRNGDKLILTLSQSDSDDKEYRRLVWTEDQASWLGRLGKTFGKYLGDSFDVCGWQNGERRHEPACYLSWDWPAARVPHPFCDGPTESQRAGFFLTLAYRLDPFVLRQATYSNDVESFAKLQFMFVLLRTDALLAAWHTVRADPFPDMSA